MSSFTQAQLIAIEAAIASGELRVSYDGREVLYRSIDDLIKAKNIIESGLEEVGTVPPRKRYSYITRRMD